MRRPSVISRKARRYHERAVRARRLTAELTAGTDRTAIERYLIGAASGHAGRSVGPATGEGNGQRR